MIGLLIEITVRTSVWIITTTTTGIYRLCFGSPADKQTDIEKKLLMLEARIKELEKNQS